MADCLVNSLLRASEGIGGSSIAFLHVLSISAYGAGDGTRYETLISFRMPTIIILWRACGIPYSSNLYKCGVTVYPYFPAFLVHLKF